MLLNKFFIAMTQLSYKIIRNEKKTNDKVTLKNLEKIEYDDKTIEYMIKQKLWFYSVRDFKFNHTKKLVFVNTN